MARARSLKPSFFTDDKIAALPPIGRLLFQGLWCVADREGRLEDKPKRIKVECLPYDKVNVENLLGLLEQLQFIIRFEAGGKSYIQIRNFLRHQEPHYKERASNIPAPKGYESPTKSKATQVNVEPTITPSSVQHRANVGPTFRGKNPLTPDVLTPLTLNPLPDSLNPQSEAVDNPPAAAVASTGNGSRRGLERETQKAVDPWPRRIPEVTDTQGLDQCAKAYGIDVRARHFGSYAELQTACFTARNLLREQREREHHDPRH
jgi:hypothetical protein